jgi:hypothetical protein
VCTGILTARVAYLGAVAGVVLRHFEMIWYGVLIMGIVSILGESVESIQKSQFKT